MFAACFQTYSHVRFIPLVKKKKDLGNDDFLEQSLAVGGIQLTRTATAVFKEKSDCMSV